MVDYKMKLFEIYLFKDQTEKRDFGGHVRFVAALSEKDATHKVAFNWGHWWRTCGIREVDADYWHTIHETLLEGKSAREASLEAFKEYSGVISRGV